MTEEGRTAEQPAQQAEDLGRASQPTAAGHHETQAVTQQITVKIARVGSDLREVTGPDGMTIQDALIRAGLDRGNMDLRVMNQPSDANHRLHQGDVVMMVPRIRGGKGFTPENILTGLEAASARGCVEVTLRVGVLGKDAKEMTFYLNPPTLRGLLYAASLRPEDIIVAVNGEVVDLDTPLINGMVLSIIPAVPKQTS